MSSTWLMGDRSRYMVGGLRIRADEPEEVALLELVRAAAHEALEVGKAEVGGAGGEEAMARERVERRVAAGAAAPYGDAVGVDVAALDEVLGRTNAVDRVDDAPVALEALAIVLP